MPPDGALIRLVLPRTGMRPLRLRGWSVACQEWRFGGSQPEAAIALELYAVHGGGWAVRLQCHPPHNAGALAWHHAELTATLAEAVDRLEAAQPDCAPDWPQAQPALGLMRAAALRYCTAHALRAAFAQGSGAFLWDICARAAALRAAYGRD